MEINELLTQAGEETRGDERLSYIAGDGRAADTFILRWER